MQVVQGDEKPVVKAPAPVRSGILSKQTILVGEPDTPGNFAFGLYYQVGDFSSPRHRHNFDQFRFQIEGECDFDRIGTMTPGLLGYFPEGAFYGPQTSDKPNVTAVVQFGGPSGAGFLSAEQVSKATEVMKKVGVFENGVFRRNEGVEGKKNMDGFQAMWEFANQRPMVYPKPQYADPILMNVEHYRWMPVDDAPGVTEKALGTFTDCAIRCARYRLDPGASFTATGRGIYLVLSGRGSVEDRPMRRLTSLYLEGGEEATLKADETSEILLMGLPNPTLMRRQLVSQSSAA
jgi:hypothetical protein